MEQVLPFDICSWIIVQGTRHAKFLLLLLLVPYVEIYHAKALQRVKYILYNSNEQRILEISAGD